MDVDEALYAIGDFGCGQILISVSVGAMAYMVPSWVAFGITFLAAIPDHFCTVPRNANVEEYIPSVETNGEYVFDSCTQYTNPGSTNRSTVPCQNGWTFVTTSYGSTIVSEWQLVCDRTHLAALAQSVLLLGVFVGSVIVGYVSDRIGRKPVLMVSLCFQGCLGVVLAFSPTFWFFLVIRFITGIFYQGCQLSGVTLISEIFTPRRRTIGFNLFAISYPIGIMILALWGFFIREWRHFQLAITFPFFVLTFICCFVPESPRWLLSAGKVQRARTSLNRLARLNGSKFHPVVLKRKSCDGCKIDNTSFNNTDTKEPGVSYQQTTREALPDKVTTVSLQVDQSIMDQNMVTLVETTKPNTTKSSTYFYLFTTRRMCLVTVILSATWLANTLAYHGLNLNSVRLAGNPYLNLFLTGGIEIPAIIVAITLSMKCGRRKSLFGLQLMSSAVCVITGFIPKQSANGLDLTAFIVTSAVAAKLFVTSAHFTVILYAAEIFPTVVRNKGMAVGSMTARTGALLAPFVVLLDEIRHSMPIIIFGVASAIPSLFVLLLPETQGRSQPETAEDIDLMYREEKLRVKVATAPRDESGSP